MNSEKSNIKIEPAEQQKRNRANMTDFIIWLVVLFIFSGNENISLELKYVIVLGYIFVLLPFLMYFLASPGQLWVNVRVRKTGEPDVRLSVKEIYLRLIIVVFSPLFNIVTPKAGMIEYIKKLTGTMAYELKQDISEEEAEMKNKRSSYIKFGLVTLIYLLWVIWVGNFWLLLGIPVIFDMYITKKVNWTPWKKRGVKNSIFIEWIDALIFAVIAVTILNHFLFQNYRIPTGSMEKSLLIGDHLYVSKVAYGPRIPNTPLTIPFTQHTIPGTSARSYVEWIQWPYKRLAGFGTVKRNDPVVFNFPEGDTVCIEQQNVSYYFIMRDLAFSTNYSQPGLKTRDRMANIPVKPDKEYMDKARNIVWNNYTVVIRPVDRRDNYIKRCVAIPGDTLKIINGIVYINGKQQKYIPGIQYKYRVYTNGKRISPAILEELDIRESDADQGNLYQGYYILALTKKAKDKLSKYPGIEKIERIIHNVDFQIFPCHPDYEWSLDNFGPLYIPKKGDKINITPDNLPLYKRIIRYYENNKLEVKEDKIYINGKEADTYTFKMDYFWMMGDNRHSSLDSRYWGYVPEDHIIGKPKFIFFSFDKDKTFLKKIRFNRMFIGIK